MVSALEPWSAAWCEAVLAVTAPLLSDRRRGRLDAVAAARVVGVRLVLERPDKPHNVAAVTRSAEALGLLHVDLVDPGTIDAGRQVSIGAHKWLLLRRFEAAGEAMADVRAQGYRVVAATLDPRAKPLQGFAACEPVALWMGNEVLGISADTARAADDLVYWPTVGFSQSLNLSVAAALAVSHVLDTHPARMQPHFRLQGDALTRLRARYRLLAVRDVRRVLSRAGIPPALDLDDETRLHDVAPGDA